MTKDDVRDYIASFNRLDFDGFGKYYAEDVKLSLSGKRTLTSRQEILDFYADVAKVCREKLDITHLVVDDEGVAIEVKTEFKALVDDPTFIAGPLVFRASPSSSPAASSTLCATASSPRSTRCASARCGRERRRFDAR
jgi:hypothetical protein